MRVNLCWIYVKLLPRRVATSILEVLFCSNELAHVSKVSRKTTRPKLENKKGEHCRWSENLSEGKRWERGVVERSTS